METPPNRTRTRSGHIPTPKMSDRKKSLFSSSDVNQSQNHQTTTSNQIDKEMNIMDGMMPLDFESAIHVQSRLRSYLRPRVKKFPENVTSILKTHDRIPLSILSNTNSTASMLEARRSPRNGKFLKEDGNLLVSSRQQAQDRNMKTLSPTSRRNNYSDDDLGDLLKDTLSLKPSKHLKTEHCIAALDKNTLQSTQKRSQPKSNQTSPKGSPKKKQAKYVESPPPKKLVDPNSNTESPSSNKNYTTSIDKFSISTESFYSSHRKSANTPPKSATSRLRLPPVSVGKTSGSKKKSKVRTRNDIRLGNNVSHKIPRPKFKPTQQTIDTILRSLNGEKFKKLLENRMYRKQAEVVDKILKSSENPIEKARPLNIHQDDDINGDEDLFSDSEGDDNQVDDATIVEPVNESNVMAMEAVANEEEVEAAVKTRKFFKSKRENGANAFTINNIRGTVNKGRVSLLPMPPTKKRAKKSTSSVKTNFTNEQAAVKDIIDWLDDDPALINPPPPANIEADITANLQDDEFRKRIPYKTTDPDIIQQQQLLLDFLISYNICNERNFEIFIMDPDNHKDEAGQIVDSLITVEPIKDRNPTNDANEEDDKMSEISEPIVLNLTDSQETNGFRQRLPYKTNDPVVAEQQKTLLEFLIKNQICDEENFNIFIAEPEKNRDKTSKILQNYMVTSHVENEPQAVLQKHIDNCMGIDPFSVVAEVPSANLADTTFETSHTTLESMMSDEDETQWQPLSPTIPLQPARVSGSYSSEDTENRSNNHNGPKLFPVFQMGKVKPIAVQSTRKKAQRPFVGGFGTNQYQIDAGQKAFGAKKCPDCGLVYTVHEPEEEKLHSIYHNSLHILKFKGWIDENIVMRLPEWGPNGRIIRVTNIIHPKRMERIVDILNIIDKELGIISDTVPTPFVAYLAIRRNEIVGFSLLQSIKKASRYICQDGIDFCTEETFDVRCGISRIWVSPLNRGQHIATKLIETIQRFTVPGVYLSLDDIAFSSPTQDGALFAQKIAKRKDFLVYESF